METLRKPPDITILSSSPAFSTPLHPIPAPRAAPPPAPPFKPAVPTILPTLLPPATLRPVAFRTFTKKHNLTLNASALQALAIFVGRHCGSVWREEGSGEKVLDEAAKLWKAEGGAVIVEEGTMLTGILKTLDACMIGGRIGTIRKGSSNLSRQSSFAFTNDSAVDLSRPRRPSLGSEGRTASFGMSKLHVDEPAEIDGDDEEDASKDPRAWLRIVSAFDQPRFTYDADKKHFIPAAIRPSPFPPPSHKTAIFRERYNIIHQRLLRNEAFQAPSFSANTASLQRKGGHASSSHYKVTPVANLLGRGGTSHLLLGQLVVAPTGTLALNDPSGSIPVSLEHATPFSGATNESDQPYFCPGMIVLVDGVYEEDWAGAGSSGLGNTSGVGGTISGRFIGFGIGGPPVEKRDTTLGAGAGAGEVGAGFGWTDFLGTGSERAIGVRMRRLERRLLASESDEGRRTMVILSEVHLDAPTTFTALRRIFSRYSDDPPLSILLIGNFLSRAALSGVNETDAISYKEAFNELAALLADYPSLLRSSTFVFVPGDNDPWASAFSVGAATCVPREPMPEVFTSRIKRAFANAKEGTDMKGQAIWTSNPARLTMFGPAHEVSVFRDEITGRLRRNAIRIGQATRQEPSGEGGDDDVVMSGALPSAAESDEQPLKDSYGLQQAKRLILTLLPQSTLSPFPLSLRPTHWDYTPSALSLYPLPHTLVLADPEMEAFACVFEGCCVVNPGPLVVGKGKAGWVEYDCWTKRGMVREEGW